MLKFRGTDAHGSGVYRASRGGDRIHNGIDICCDRLDPIRAFMPGKVTKIGYPYSQAEPKPYFDFLQAQKFRKKKALRYVQITDGYGIHTRYFYVDPIHQVGDMIAKNQVIGTAQGLDHIFPGITEHFHFEVLKLVKGNKVFLDPEQYLKAIGEI